MSSAVLAGVVGGRDQFAEVWTAMLQALENSEQQLDFSEFKHAATLKKQVWHGVQHVYAKIMSMLNSPKLLETLPNHINR